MDDVTIEDNVSLTNCIVCKGVVIKNKCTLKGKPSVNIGEINMMGISSVKYQLICLTLSDHHCSFEANDGRAPCPTNQFKAFWTLKLYVVLHAYFCNILLNSLNPRYQFVVIVRVNCRHFIIIPLIKRTVFPQTAEYVTVLKSRLDPIMLARVW